MTTIKPVFRFKFTDEMIHYMRDFAYLHKDDARSDFKDSWETWKNSDKISELIQSENMRLTEMGYKGDLEKKIYTSVRYYYRKKANEYGVQQKSEFEMNRTDSNSGNTNKISMNNVSVNTNNKKNKSVKKQPKRAHYITVSKELLNSMDEFINEYITHDKYQKPSYMYTEFLEKKNELIEKEMNCLKNVVYYDVLSRSGENKTNSSGDEITLTKDEILEKLKKTFKNRYFVKTKSIKQA